MQDRTTTSTPSAESSVWVWIILAGLLLLAGLVAIASLAIMSATQQNQMPTTTQPAQPPAR